MLEWSASNPKEDQKLALTALQLRKRGHLYHGDNETTTSRHSQVIVVVCTVHDQNEKVRPEETDEPR
jgi:hypothetical protein